MQTMYYKENTNLTPKAPMLKVSFPEGFMKRRVKRLQITELSKYTISASLSFPQVPLPLAAVRIPFLFPLRPIPHSLLGNASSTPVQLSSPSSKIFTVVTYLRDYRLITPRTAYKKRFVWPVFQNFKLVPGFTPSRLHIQI